MQALQQLPGVYAEVVPPEGARRTGQMDAHGRDIYERELREPIRKVHVEINGVLQYKKHPTTGEPITPVLKNVWETRTQRFVIIRGRNGCNGILEVVEESAEERAHVERLKKIADVKEQIAEALVDNDLSVDALIAALKPARKGKAD